MKQLLEHKQHHASAGNGYFCIFDHDDLAELAKQLCKEGKLEKVRSRTVTTEERGFSYTVYKIADDES